MSRWHTKLTELNKSVQPVQNVQIVQNTRATSEHIEQFEHTEKPYSEFMEQYEERAAIGEYTGGLARHEAEIQAYRDMFLEFVSEVHPQIRAEFDAVIKTHAIN